MTNLTLPALKERWTSNLVNDQEVVNPLSRHSSSTIDPAGDEPAARSSVEPSIDFSISPATDLSIEPPVRSYCHNQPSPELGSLPLRTKAIAGERGKTPKSSTQRHTRSSAGTQRTATLLRSADSVPGTKRRSSSASLASDSSIQKDGVGNGEPAASRKRPKLSSTAKLSRQRAVIETIMKVESLSDVGSPNFRHPACNNKHCQNADIGHRPQPHHGQRPDDETPVFADQHFEPSEMTERQIRYILNRCPCAIAQAFEDSWRECPENWKTFSTKQSYVLARYPRTLDEIVRRFCPPSDDVVVELSSDSE